MSTHPNDTPFLHAFNCINGIGPHKLYTLSRFFDSFADAWDAPKDTLIAAGLSEKIADTIVRARKKIDVGRAWETVEKEHVRLISVRDACFPPQCADLPNPPFCLYVRGAVEALTMPSVAIVGSRTVSQYGAHATTTFATALAHAGIAVISGLALGTDSIAHRTTLDAQGTTVAVLAGGVDDATITPRTHHNLAQHILANGGAIISEYPCYTQPSRGTFPVRNRLMAALAHAVIIIEATQKSGTLITAEHAKKCHRPLFALPGSIFAAHAHGPNTLIQTHDAQPILTSDDVLRIFTKKAAQKNAPQFTGPHQKHIYDIINASAHGVPINTIIKQSALDTQTVSTALTIMELDGHITNIGNQTYICTP
ncbi:MAG: DNA-protecting protein DprA [Candidatus Moraniibacteriota bacterium]|nr:MAG: DNA-protecting protein DprA [Candidatus Moranbacteria bacterium]